MKICLHDAFAELISPDRSLRAEQQWFSRFCADASVKDRRIPVLEQPFFHDHILVVASRRSVQVRLWEVDHAEALFHPRDRIILIGRPDIQDDVVRRDLRLSREQHQGAPHAGRLTVLLHEFIQEYHVLAVRLRITLIPVFICTDIHRIAAEHRIFPAKIIVIQSLHKFSGCLCFCRFRRIAAVDIQREHLDVVV